MSEAEHRPPEPQAAGKPRPRAPKDRPEHEGPGHRAEIPLQIRPT